ncbi:hypothetical protein EVAR_85574_1 [Eumeta japonica]|uniref:Nucleic-acid-binding protein from transposon X-element n=1 Tax=Eumeta variegata TaxID=151549 RepID=A0A4C2AD91_EUMVA|nr:hypothetical protein EVAR_85574_1 [Eumeta japonica]
MSPAPDMWWSWSGKSEEGRGTRGRGKAVQQDKPGEPRQVGGDPQGCDETCAACYELRRSGGETKTAAVAADPGPLQDLVPDTPSSWLPIENHTAEHVITKLRGVVDAREMGVAVDRIRKARGQRSRLGKGQARVCYRRRARNDLECHPVLEVSPELYHRLIKPASYTGLQRRPVWDQSPLVQCSRCLGYGHGKRYCKEVSERCAHCGGEHTGVTCRARKDGEPPKCVNCTKAGCEDTAHGAFSSECGVRAKWDDMARSKVAYC